MQAQYITSRSVNNLEVHYNLGKYYYRLKVDRLMEQVIGFFIDNPFMLHLQAQYINIVNNVEKYYSGPMATAFWSTQFIQDTHQLMTKSTNNSGTAEALWSKYL